jgi:hypothetical protein
MRSSDPGRLGEVTRRGDIIIIAPPEVPVRVVTSDPARTLFFSSIEQFVQWKDGRTAGVLTLAGAVAEVLDTLGCPVSMLPPDAVALLEWLARQERVPPLKAFAEAVTSRRTFFRRWAAVPESPSVFLAWVRAAHARHLLNAGATCADAMLSASYQSSPALLAAVQELTPTNAIAAHRTMWSTTAVQNSVKSLNFDS